MLLTGSIALLVNSRRSILKSILKEYVTKKFTGYIVYRAPSVDSANIEVEVYVTLYEGNIIACRLNKYTLRKTLFAVVKVPTSILGGLDCCNEVTKYLEREGQVEVRSADPKNLLVELTLFPLSRVEESTELAKLVEANVGLPVVAPPPLPPTPLPPIITAPIVTPTPPRIEEVKPALTIVEKPVVEEKPAVSVKTEVLEKPLISILDECFDPIILLRVTAALLRSSEMLENIREPTLLRDVLKRIEDLVKSKDIKSGYIYVSGYIDNNTIRIIYSAENKSLNIQVESTEGYLCGKRAVDKLLNEKTTNTRIWFMPSIE